MEKIHIEITKVLVGISVIIVLCFEASKYNTDYNIKPDPMVLELENRLKQKDIEITNLKVELKELAQLKRMQKDIARVFDGRED